MKKRHSEEQIIQILREAELHAVPIRDLCKQHNISEQTFYRWRDKYGGMEVPDALAIGIKTTTKPYPLERANEALAALRNGEFSGAAVLVP